MIKLMRLVPRYSEKPLTVEVDYATPNGPEILIESPAVVRLPPAMARELGIALIDAAFLGENRHLLKGEAS